MVSPILSRVQRWFFGPLVTECRADPYITAGSNFMVIGQNLRCLTKMILRLWTSRNIQHPSHTPSRFRRKTLTSEYAPPQTTSARFRVEIDGSQHVTPIRSHPFSAVTRGISCRSMVNPLKIPSKKSCYLSTSIVWGQAVDLKVLYYHASRVLTKNVCHFKKNDSMAVWLLSEQVFEKFSLFEQ